MIKTMIYPYDEESYPLVKFKNRLSEIEIVKTVSPKGWRFKENEINGIKVEYDFITALDECEAVWFVEPMLELPFEEMIIPKLDLAIQKNKSIIWTRKENLKCDKEYKRIEKETDGVEENLFESEELYKIDIPVIAVLGITERTNKYEIQLALQQELEMRGINTYILGSRNIPFFSRVFRIPEKLLNMQNDRYQILGFNHYVKRIEKVYQPDCIIVGVPGETSAFSTKIVNNFGMLCKKMLEAINPDLVVLSTADELFEKQGVIELKNSIKERLNVEVDYVNVVPRYLDFYESQLSGKLNFITLEDEFVLDNINLLSLDNVYCLTREQEVKKLVDNILKILSGDKYEVL